MKRTTKKIIKKYSELINNTINSKACSYIPDELIEAFKEIAEEERINLCLQCSSSLYNFFKIVKNKYM